MVDEGTSTPAGGSVSLLASGAVHGRTRAMATDITVVAHGAAAPSLLRAVNAALEVFHQVHAQCTRFDASSPLMRANAASTTGAFVPALCWRAIAAAAQAYRRTEGSFDPRVHDDLVRLGYGTSRAFDAGDESKPTAARAADGRAALPPWQPEFGADGRRVRIGPWPIDLGGIGKGLAVSWAAERLAAELGDRFPAHGHLIEAGGDCAAHGEAPEGGGWLIGVEDPFATDDGDDGEPARPLLVLGVRDRAVATSSTRVRNWRVGGRAVHHLIDPRTGLPGGAWSGRRHRRPGGRREHR